VDFKPDDGLVLGECFWRKTCNGWHPSILSIGAHCDVSGAS
jgi:hypothetical protein